MKTIVSESNKENAFDFFDGHPWVIPTFLGGLLAALGLNELGNYNAMKRGYDRSFKLGKLDVSVHKKTLEHKTIPDADGGQPLIS